MTGVAAWSPTQWSGFEGDISPELPAWEASLKMIREKFQLPGDASLTLEGHGHLTATEFAPTILTLAYCCLRGLTVRETMGYFGKAGEALHVTGASHPVRALMYIIGSGGGDDPIAKHISFLGSTNPLIEVENDNTVHFHNIAVD